MKGYKEAIWDRIPYSWKEAAIKTRCKQRMINCIYADMNLYVKTKCTENKKYDKEYCKILKQTYLSNFNNPNTPFCLAFDWNNSSEGLGYWKSVNNWINYYKDYLR